MTAEEAAEAARGLTFEKVWAALMESRQRMEEDRREMKEFQQESQRRIEEIHRKNEKTIADLKAELSKSVGGISNSLGQLTESMFSPELEKKFSEYGYRFKTQANNKVFRDDQQFVAEVDSILENGEYAMLVEIKTKLTVENVDDHLDRISKIRKHMDTLGDNRKLVGAVAGGIVSSNVMTYAYNRGLYVMVQSGDATKVADTPDGFRAREW